MSRLPGPILHTDRLTLRVPKLRDVRAIYTAVRHPHVHRYLAIEPPTSSKDTLAFVRRVALEQRTGESLVYVLHDRATGELAGCCGAHHVDRALHRKAEIGFWLARPFWGFGLMREALGAFIPHLFVRLDLHRLFAQAFLRNVRSQRLLEGLGFEYEGVLRQHVRKGGRAFDVRQYGLLNSDPAARRLIAAAD